MFAGFKHVQLQTSDPQGTINLCIVSPTGYIRDAFAHLGLP